MRKYTLLGLLIIVMTLNIGCGILRAIVPDSPRPNTKQIEAAKDLSEQNVSIIAGLQSNKQENMARIAETALSLVGSSTTSIQSAAITNITANALKAIEKADGTRKTLGSLQGKTIEDVLRMTTAQYLGGVAAQTAADVENKETLYKGLEAGFQWTKTNGIGLILALMGTGGLGTMALKLRSGLIAAEESLGIAQQRNDNLSALNKATASGIEQWKSLNPVAWTSLKPILTEAHSAIPLNVPEELGLPKEKNA